MRVERHIKTPSIAFLTMVMSSGSTMTWERAFGWWITLGGSLSIFLSFIHRNVVTNWTRSRNAHHTKNITPHNACKVPITFHLGNLLHLYLLTCGIVGMDSGWQDFLVQSKNRDMRDVQSPMQWCILRIAFTSTYADLQFNTWIFHKGKEGLRGKEVANEAVYFSTKSKP